MGTIDRSAMYDFARAAARKRPASLEGGLTVRIALHPPRPRTGVWELLGATLSRRDLLVGPSPRDVEHEALVLAPPGVRLPGSSASIDTWRAALWSAGPSGHCHVDVGSPSHLEPVSLAYVLELVGRECPQWLPWVADQLEGRIRNAVLVRQPDDTGRVLSFATRWRRDVELMLDELDIALATLPGTEEQPDLTRHDPRLRARALRELYDQLSRDADGTAASARPRT